MKKRVMLVTFSANILRDAVLELQKKDFEIAYWTGYKPEFEAFSKDKKNFPHTIFHNNYDALQCVPAQDIDTSVFPAVPKKVFDYVEKYRVQALSLMERNNITGMTLRQLNRLFNEHVQYWHGVLETQKIDAIIFSNIPHIANNFIIYHVAKGMGLKTITFNALKIPTRVIITDDYREHTKLSAAYTARLQQDIKEEDLPKDILEYYKKQIDNNRDATPFYIKKDYVKKRSRSNDVLPRFSSVIENVMKLTIFKITIKYLRMLFTKGVTLLSLEGETRFTGIAYKRMQRTWVKVKKSFEEEYATIEGKPDFSVPYIYVPLHNQPELNTNPLGGIFDDQLLLIEMLAKTMPKGWKIYVKETPLQWKWPLGHLGRYSGYYKKLAAIPGVVVLSPSVSTFDLIDSCKAVATISGTAGWEALFRGKPALVFGLVWYRYCKGVFQIQGRADLEKAFTEIENGATINVQAIIQFLAAIGDTAIRATLDKRFEVPGVSASYNETVHNLAEGWYKEIESCHD